MIERLTTNWHLMRIVRLIIGVMVLVQAWEMGEWMLGGMGVWLTSMAVFNIGCCGVEGCSTSAADSSKKMTDITYETIKGNE